MDAFGLASPEIDHRLGRAHVDLGVAFLRVDEFGKLEGIAHEEDGRVVTHHVPVAILGMEFQGQAAHVALGIGRPAFAGHGQPARQDLVAVADLQEQLGSSVLRNVMGVR